MPAQESQMLHEQFACFQVLRPAPESVLESGLVVDIHRNDAVRADRLQQARQITDGHRIARLGAAVLPRVGQVRSDGSDAPGGRVLDGPDEEQQPAQLVVDAALGITLERLNHIDVLVPHPHQRADLDLAVLETPLLMGADRDFEVIRDPSSMPPQPGPDRTARCRRTPWWNSSRQRVR